MTTVKTELLGEGTYWVASVTVADPSRDPTHRYWEAGGPTEADALRNLVRLVAAAPSEG